MMKALGRYLKSTGLDPFPIRKTLRGKIEIACPSHRFRFLSPLQRTGCGAAW